MASLELSSDQAGALREQLERAIFELNDEIGATDRREYREHIKTRRRLLQEVLQQLQA